MLTNKDLWLTTSCGMIELIEEHIVNVNEFLYH